MRYLKPFARITGFVLLVLIIKIIKSILSGSPLNLHFLLILILLLVGVILGSWLWDFQYLITGSLTVPELQIKNLTDLKRFFLISWQENWADRPFFSPFESLFFLLIWLAILVLALTFPTWNLTIGIISGFNYRLATKISRYLKKGYPDNFFLFLRQRPTKQTLDYFVWGWLIIAVLLNLLII